MSPRKDGQHRDRMVPLGWEDKPGIEAILLGLIGNPTAIDHIGSSLGREKSIAYSGPLLPSLASQLITPFDPVVDASGTQNISPDLVQQLIVAFNPSMPSEGDDDLMAVTRITTSTSLTESGLYIVDSSGGVRTITLPLLSSLGADGMVFKIKREGANFVDIDCAGSDAFEPGGIFTKRLFTNWSAFSFAADDAANYWYDYGYYGAIQ